MKQSTSLEEQLREAFSRYNPVKAPAQPVHKPEQNQPAICSITGWRYTVDVPPPRGSICPHPAILHGASWTMPAHPTRGQLVLALGACLYSLYQIGLYDPRNPLTPSNFTNHWLLDSLGCIRDTVVHCVKVGTLCRKRYPRLVGDEHTTSNHIENWLNSIDTERQSYEPMSLVNKGEETLTQRILATLSQHATSEQALRIATYGYKCAEAAGYSQDSKVAITLVATIQRPQFASYIQLRNAQQMLWDHAEHDTEDTQRLLLAIIQRIDTCLAKFLSKDNETKAAYINASLAGGHNIFEQGLKAMLPPEQAAKQSALEATMQAKKELANDTFANKFALQLAKLQKLQGK